MEGCLTVDDYQDRVVSPDAHTCNASNISKKKPDSTNGQHRLAVAMLIIGR